MARVTSNSEAKTFQACERQWWYAFAMRLKPRQLSNPLSYGILGHAALETYYDVLQNGGKWTDAYQAAYITIMSYLNKPVNELIGDEGDIAQVVADRFSRYAGHYQADDFKVIGVEKELRMPLYDGMEYALKADLLVEFHRGPYRGEVVIIDHKWTYDFWSTLAVQLHPQMPKYIKVARYNGYPVKRAIINQIRYRQFSEPYPEISQLVYRQPCEPTEKAIEEHWRDQQILSKRIELLTRQDVVSSGTLVTRSTDREKCRNCAFNLICKMEMYGEDAGPTIRSAFVPNDYGYDNTN